MPYADRQKQLEWRRNYFKAKYAKEKGKPLNAAATKRAKAKAKTTRKKKA